MMLYRICSLENRYVSYLQREWTTLRRPSHSNTLAWKIPWAEEPGRLQSMGSWRVRHNWATSLSLFTFMHWTRKWQLTPVFFPGESQGWGSLVGCRLWGCAESDTTEATQQQQQQQQEGPEWTCGINCGQLHRAGKSGRSIFCLILFILSAPYFFPFSLMSHKLINHHIWLHGLGLNFQSSTVWLCDLRQVSLPLCALVSYL